MADGAPRSPTTSAQWISPGSAPFHLPIRGPTASPSYTGSTPVFHGKLEKFLLWRGPPRITKRPGTSAQDWPSQPGGPRLPGPAPSTCHKQTPSPLFPLVFHAIHVLLSSCPSIDRFILPTGASGTSYPDPISSFHLPIHHVRQVPGGDHPRGRQCRRQARGPGASRR